MIYSGMMIQRKRPKEKFAFVLDFMKEGNPLDRHKIHKNKPVAQLLGYDYFILLEGSVIDKELQIEEKVDLETSPYIKIDFIISYDDLTSVARDTLNRVIRKIIEEKESLFVEFFNKSEPLTLKLHALELLPGIGKKTLWTILDERKKKPFESFRDIEVRTGIKSVADILAERILAEIMHKDKYYLFVYPVEADYKRVQEQHIYVGYLERLRQNV